MTDTGLRYWAVVVLPVDGQGFGSVAITDGDYNPHTEEAAIKAATYADKVDIDVADAVGPFGTSDLARQYLTDAAGNNAGLNVWLTNAARKQGKI